MTMKATIFEAVSLIEGTVARELKEIQEEAFSRAFHMLHERSKFYTEAGRDYIE
jgi:hypothetical protein